MIICTTFKRSKLKGISVKEADDMVFNEELYPCWYVDREFDTRSNGLTWAGQSDIVANHLRAKTCQRRRGMKDGKAHDVAQNNIHSEKATKQRRHL